MVMDDEKLKRLLEEDAEIDMERILEEVNSDPEFRDVVAPEEIHDKLFEQIREQEAERSKEDEELIRLGKIYKKKRSRRKYWVIAAAIVCAFALGITSLGGAEKVFKELERILDDRKQTVINNDDSGENSFSEEVATVEEAYELIDKKFGVYPPRLYYLPGDMEFVEVMVEEELQVAQMYYEDQKGGVINYRISTNHRLSSIGTDIEDNLLREYDEEINGVLIKIKEYSVEGMSGKRWNVTFAYDSMNYSLYLMNIQEEDVKKIIENLYFS